MDREDFQWKNKEHILELEQFQGKKGQGLPLLYFPLLLAHTGVKNCFTTREGGCSTGMFQSLNLSFTRGDDPQAVTENYRRVAEAMGGTLSDIVCSDQTHTTNVRRVDRSCGGYGVTKEQPYTNVDGLVTDEPGLILATFYADCVPLYFVDPIHHAIGLSHSGWRGTVGRMGQHTIEVMRREFHSDPGEILAAVGPSICQDCYEVSEDVALHFIDVFGESYGDSLLYRKENGKYQLNLHKACEITLLDAGVKAENLDITDLCTCCNPEFLFSHRASNGKRGNLAGVMMLREKQTE
ncbi:MAG TPA: peptidoglycan editing factor PgeF [Lachnospiraceae bacterium]|nr:peptidoglycan editing factor PgeF [Lachnospiraceae bacterium]